MMAYQFENRIHHVCTACHDTDATHEYSHEIQTINQKHLIVLQRDLDRLRERVGVLSRKESILCESLIVLQTEIASCKEIETRYTAQITALVETLANGRIAQTQVQNQDNRRALRQVEGRVYRKMPASGDHSLAFMMLADRRLGDTTDCSAGQEQVLDMGSSLCPRKSDLDVQKGNCQTLVATVRVLLQQDPLSIIERINNAGYKQSIAFTAEEGVLSNIASINVVDEDVRQTMLHVLYSAEFRHREFEERREISIAKGGGFRSVHSVPRRIHDYVSHLVKSVEDFSAGLLALNMLAGSSSLLCVIVKEFYDEDDSCGDTVVPKITQGDMWTAPKVSVDMSDNYEICEISLYNLGDQDLFFSDNQILKSAQLHEGNFLIRGHTDTEVPKHDRNTVPASGFGYLEKFQRDWEENYIEYQLKDVNGTVMVTLALQFTK
jgi:hypothetical protein